MRSASALTSFKRLVIVQGFIYMRFAKNPFTYYSVDIDYQKSIPIKEVAERLGISFQKGGHCFCPDPNCPDASSKRPSAHITNHNTIHCFVCGNTWNNFTLAGMRAFGYDGRECFANGKAITTVGKYISEEMGFGGARVIIYDREAEPAIPLMPQVRTHDIDGNSFLLPLWRCIGLSDNPFSPVRIREDGKARPEQMQLSESEAVLIVTLKCLETLQIANDYELTDDPDDLLLRDYETLRIAIEGYLRKLQPLILPDDRKAVRSELLYQYVFTEDEAYRMRLSRIFPEDMQLIIGKLEEAGYEEPERETDYEQ